MKKSIKLIISMIIGLFLGAYMMVSYALSFNSEEISYDTSTSGAVQSNVKDALDFLYNKTKSGASSECPENMSCVEKPGVTLNVSGPGSVDKGTVYVGIGETNIFTVTPSGGNVLTSISCDNGYTLSSFKTSTNSSTKAECEAPQTITITNPNTANGATCNVYFGSYDIKIETAYAKTTCGAENCSSAAEGCVCWYIKNGGSNFTYGSHTGCNIKSSTCYHSTNKDTFDCSKVYWRPIWTDGTGYYRWYGVNDSAYCAAVITCAT